MRRRLISALTKLKVALEKKSESTTTKNRSATFRITASTTYTQYRIGIVHDWVDDGWTWDEEYYEENGAYYYTKTFNNGTIAGISFGTKHEIIVKGPYRMEVFDSTSTIGGVRYMGFTLSVLWTSTSNSSEKIIFPITVCVLEIGSSASYAKKVYIEIPKDGDITIH